MRRTMVSVVCMTPPLPDTLSALGVFVALLLRFDERCVGLRGLSSMHARVPPALTSGLDGHLTCAFPTSRQAGSQTYFRATLTAYVLGLLTTMVVMHTFKAAQVCASSLAHTETALKTSRLAPPWSKSPNH